MGRVCCFPGCESKDRSWSTYSFHRIPLRDIGLRQLWLAALNMDICTPPGALKQLRVCSLHFSKEDFLSPPPGKSQRCTLKYTSVPMHQGENPLTERTGKEFRKEEEKEEAMQDEEPQNAQRIKEEQRFEADDVSVVIIPGLTDDGQTETVTGGVIKREPEQCEIDRHGDSSHTSGMTEEEEEQPIVRILKQETEDMAWETSSHWDTLGQETGNGDDSFLQTKSIKAEPDRCEIGCHGATEEERPIVRTLKREAEDMTWETSSHSDSQEQETGNGDDSSLLVVVKDSRPVKLLRCPCSCETGSAPCEHVAAWLDRMSHTSQVEVVVVPPADSFSEAMRTWYKPGEIAVKSRRPSDRMVIVSSRPRERKMEECWRSSLCGGDIGDPLDLSARLVEVYGSFSSDEAPLIATMGISTETPLVDSAGMGCPYEEYSLSVIEEYDSGDIEEQLHLRGSPVDGVEFSRSLQEGEDALHLRCTVGSVEVSQVFPCTRCSVSFTGELYLHRHLKRSHPEDYVTLIQSKSCQPDSLSSESNECWSQAPSGTTAEPSLFASESCSRAVTPEAKAHACSHCGKSFTRKSDLKVHERSHTGEKPYPCTQCGRSFVCSDVLKRHLRTHTGERPYRCSKCTKTFSVPYNLARHERTHAGLRPHFCGECGKTFARVEDLQKHRQMHAGDRHRCQECGKTYGHRETLRMHLQSHTGERPYRCTECGKDFSFSRDLKKHQITHSGERPYRCPQCPKSFGRVWDLTIHQRSHSGERPYHCSQCGQSFSLIGNYRRHQLTHSGERTFHCSQCAKSFVRAAHLKHHLRTHTQEKEYSCSRCGKSFNHRGNFKRHQKSHSGE